MALQIPNISGAALGPGSRSRSGSPSGGQLAALILQAYGAKSSGPMAHRTALDKVKLEHEKIRFSEKKAAVNKHEKLAKDLKVATEKYEALVGSETLKNEAMGYLQAGDYKKFLTVAPFIKDLDPNIVKTIEERQARAGYGAMTPEQRATDAQRLGKTTPRQRAISGGIGRRRPDTSDTDRGWGLTRRPLRSHRHNGNYQYINKLEERGQEVVREDTEAVARRESRIRREKLDMIDEWEKNGEITPEEAKQDREDLRAQFLDLEDDEEDVSWAEYQKMTPENQTLYDRYKGRTGRGPSAKQQANEVAGKFKAQEWLKSESGTAGLSEEEATEIMNNLEEQPTRKDSQGTRGLGPMRGQ